MTENQNIEPDLDNQPEPDVLADEITENLEARLNSFKEIAAALS
jgi:type I restriction enzyme M protein